MPHTLIAKHRLVAALLATLSLLAAPPAFATDEIIVTHAKALAGNVVPGDAPGYPVQLKHAGSYLLGSNLNVPAGKAGFEILADDVTVDLAGYRLFGNGKGALNGIVGASGMDRTTIKNGTIAEFKFDGVFGTGQFWLIENMRVVSNGRYGVRVAGDAQIRDSTIGTNGVDGVICGNSCLVDRNTATANGGNGILCARACHAEGNVVTFNGVYGIYFTDGLALGNTVSRNGSFGIRSGNATFAVYGNNALTGNNQGNVQAQGVTSLHANYCYPNACP